MPEASHAFAGNFFDALAHALFILPDKGPAEQRGILRMLPQGRHGNGKYIQPIVEVLSEFAFLHIPKKIPVGGCDDAHVHLQRTAGSLTLEPALFQHPQQVGLNLMGQVADLVQKQGGPVPKSARSSMTHPG
jgi:hypothetical protein